MSLRDTIEDLYSAIDNLTKNMNNNIEIINNNTETMSEDFTKIVTTQDDRIGNLTHRVDILEEKIKQKGLVNPSYSELVQFIVEDHTDSKPYIEENNRFVCTDFADTFINNFREDGYFSCLTVLSFNDGSHAIVSVNTTDRGLIYVEPQTDSIIYNLNVGENYCSRVDWNCYWKIKNIKSCFGSFNS